VWDTGLGILGEHIPRIFEEHYQIPNADQREGTGLGLAIVQQLGKILKHRVDLRTTSGKGSVFSIEVPLVDVQHQVPSEATTFMTNDYRPFRGTILVIENDPYVSGGLESLFESEGVNVIVASKGDEALDLVGSEGIRPDLILSDLNLAGLMDGIESIRALRTALRSKVPAIILTGEIRSKPLEAVARHDVGIALKPVNADELLQLISEIWSASQAGVPKEL
jgi:two-component system CheB/CheR fusion protein